MKLPYLSLSFVAAVLSLAIVVQTGLVAPKFSAKTAGKSLKQSVPGNLPGWSVEELPVGPTELDRTVISQCLNYDELIYRRYYSARGSFCLYAAYWAPQRMSPCAVGIHTPDGCWMLMAVFASCRDWRGDMSPNSLLKRIRDRISASGLGGVD